MRYETCLRYNDLRKVIPLGFVPVAGQILRFGALGPALEVVQSIFDVELGMTTLDVRRATFLDADTRMRPTLEVFEASLRAMGWTPAVTTVAGVFAAMRDEVARIIAEAPAVSIDYEATQRAAEGCCDVIVLGSRAEALPEPPPCAMCGGPNIVLGYLNGARHCRCRDCGMESSG